MPTDMRFTISVMLMRLARYAPVDTISHHTPTDPHRQTALQHYCRLYKQEKIAQAHALLRKARRLDLILNVRSDVAVLPIAEDASLPERRCHECQTQFSPAFYEISQTSSPFVAQGHATAWLCHKCHFGTIQQPPAAINPVAAELLAVS